MPRFASCFTALCGIAVLSSTGCRLQPSEQQPAIEPVVLQSRQEYLDWAGRHFRDFFPSLPLERSGLLSLADGTVIGSTVATLAQQRDGKYRLRNEVRAIRGEQEVDFQTEALYASVPPFQLLRYSWIERSEANPTTGSVLVTNGGAAIRTSDSEEVTRIGPIEHTLLDELAEELWVRSFPAEGASLTVQEFDPAISRGPPTLRRIQMDSSAQGNISERLQASLHSLLVTEHLSSQGGELETRSLHGFNEQGGYLFSRLANGIEWIAHSQAPLSSAQVDPAIPLPAATPFYLPHELSDRPLHFDRIRDATVKICRGDMCGTGFFISSDGYLLTAAHVVSGGFGEIIIPELGHAYKVEHTAARGEARSNHDFVVLKVSRRGRSRHESEFPCIPLASRSPRINEELWSVGFPMRTIQDSPYFSDGIHEFTFLSRMANGESDGLNYRTRLGHWRDDLSLHHLEHSAAPGMSGGPVVDRDGRVQGLIVLVQSPVARPMRSETYDTRGRQTGFASAGRIRTFVAEAGGELFARRTFSCSGAEVSRLPVRPGGRTRVLQEELSTSLMDSLWEEDPAVDTSLNRLFSLLQARFPTRRGSTFWARMRNQVLQRLRNPHRTRDVDLQRSIDLVFPTYITPEDRWSGADVPRISLATLARLMVVSHDLKNLWAQPMDFSLLRELTEINQWISGIERTGLTVIVDDPIAYLGLDFRLAFVLDEWESRVLEQLH